MLVVIQKQNVPLADLYQQDGSQDKVISPAEYKHVQKYLCLWKLFTKKNYQNCSEGSVSVHTMLLKNIRDVSYVPGDLLLLKEKIQSVKAIRN